MSIPTVGEEYSKLMEYIRKAQECSAMLSHLERDNDRKQAMGWFAVSELMKRLVERITDLAMKRRH